jgi:hypothetical protein
VATFVIGATTATFHATIVQSTDTMADNERLDLSILWDTDADCRTLFGLITTKYHVHTPLSSATNVIDIAKGAGVGTLTVSGLMTAHALLVDCRRTRWVRNGRELGSATFLVTSIP